jgi:predicted nucleic acid-binding protein
MDTVYVETTVIGHVAGRLHPDPRIHTRQLITREWWSTAAAQHQLLVSEMVVSECSDGDSSAAAERLQVIEGVELLGSSEAVDDLAQALIDQLAVPATEPRDALHIAIAAVNGVQYIVTWNFKHILNPTLQAKIALVCRECGYEPPIICTPEQLLEVQNDS